MLVSKQPSSRLWSFLRDSHCIVSPAYHLMLHKINCVLRHRNSFRLEAEGGFYRDSGTYRHDPIKVAAPAGKTYTWKQQGFTHCSASCLGGDFLYICIVVFGFVTLHNVLPKAGGSMLLFNFSTQVTVYRVA
jgi:hypothetical protein